MNKSRILALSGGALAILLLVIGGTWFWSVGSVAAEKLPSIRVQSVTGTTEYKTGDVWSVVADVQEIHTGESVRTGADSEAQILWGDQGVTRLDANTEIVIDEAPTDGAGDDASIIRLKVNAGRIWNRMLKLLDVDSAMEVTTSDVVATVRGTSYGIIKQPTCTEAAVTESAVGVLASGASGEVLLTDDQWGSFGANDCKKPVRKLTKDDTWPTEQKAKDIKFDRDYMGAIRSRFDERAKQGSSAPAFIREASERLHLAVASPSAREELATSYAKRDLALAVTNPANTKTSLTNIRGLLPQMGAKAGLLRGELHIATTLLARSRYPGLREDIASLPFAQSLTGDSSLGELRLLRDTIVSTGDADTRYRELVRIDEGVDDVLAGVSLTEGRTRAVADLMSRLDAVDSELVKLGDTRLVSKSRAIRARLMVALDIPDVTVPIETTPEEKPIIRINEPSLKAPVIKAPTPTQTSRVYQSLKLLPSTSAPIGGQTVTLKLYGIKSDGLSEEITSQSTFSLSRTSDGTLQGNYLIPKFIGSITINAVYRDAIGSRTASATITHSTAKVSTALQSIEIRFTGPTTVTCSASLPYKVFAIYGTGVSKDVSISTTVTVSDPKLLYPGDGKILTFCSGQQATGTVTARYTEQGVTKTATASITVTPDILNTTRPSYRYP